MPSASRTRASAKTDLRLCVEGEALDELRLRDRQGFLDDPPFRDGRKIEAVRPAAGAGFPPQIDQTGP